jgi:ABC-type phosphate transport system substrate-binding protein
MRMGLCPRARCPGDLPKTPPMAQKRSKFILLLLAIVAWLPVPAAMAEEVVVTATKGPITALTRDEVRDLFLGHISSLPDGVNVVLVDLPESSPLRNEFYLKVTNKTAAQARALWAKLYFTGRGIPPYEAHSAADVKTFLNHTPGSIGYIDSSAIDPSVKVVFVVN